MHPTRGRRIVGVDLFCGAGGLTRGLRDAGIAIVAGVDLDPTCEFPYEHNNDGADFIKADVKRLRVEALAKLYPRGCIRLLAGCAPCQPFSPLRRGVNTSRNAEWGLLDAFARLTRALKPELVTMENVPDLASKSVFRRFLKMLKGLQYNVAYKSVYCPQYGIPQHRRRLVLIASRLGPVQVPMGHIRDASDYPTVREAIGDLPPVAAGKRDKRDRLHVARSASALNLRRLRASSPGGTWREWPKELRAKCHARKSGATYQSVYARMAWDEPAPTITTLAYSFGSGRFGHPAQHRSLTLREAAILQTFPRRYRFVPPKERVPFSQVGRLIGNAVPPKLARAIGEELLRAITRDQTKRDASVRSED
jgi:DNA (cytosine-5)-methyltransferase 1